MTINLYFKKMPDSVNYFLFIPEFKSGKVFDVTIPSKIEKHMMIDTPGKTEPFVDDKDQLQWPPVNALDITTIVFPGYKSKEKE